MPYDQNGEWIPITGAMPAAGGIAKGRNAQKGRADWLMLREAIAAAMQQSLTDDDIRKNLGYPKDWRVTGSCRARAIESIAERALRALASGMADSLTHEGVLKIAGFASFDFDHNFGLHLLLTGPAGYYRYLPRKDRVKVATQSVALVMDKTEQPGEHVLATLSSYQTHFYYAPMAVMVPFERDIAIYGGLSIGEAGNAFEVGVQARITTMYEDHTVTKDLSLLNLVIVIRCRLRPKGNGEWEVVGSVPPGQRAELRNLWDSVAAIDMMPYSSWPVLRKDLLPEIARSDDIDVWDLLQRGQPVTLDEVAEYKGIGAMRAKVKPASVAIPAWLTSMTEEGNINLQRRWNDFTGYPFEVIEAALIREFEYVKIAAYKDSNHDGLDDGDGPGVYCQYIESRRDQAFLEEGAWFVMREVGVRPDDPSNVIGAIVDTSIPRKTKPRVRARFSAAFRNEIAAS